MIVIFIIVNTMMLTWPTLFEFVAIVVYVFDHLFSALSASSNALSVSTL